MRMNHDQSGLVDMRHESFRSEYSDNVDTNGWDYKEQELAQDD